MGRHYRKDSIPRFRSLLNLRPTGARNLDKLGISGNPGAAAIQIPKEQQKGCATGHAALLCNREVAEMNDDHDRIEKRIELTAPIGRVWRVLTDYQEFGEWFRVKLDSPFVPGQTARGQVLHPGYEHLTWEAVVQTMEPEHLFSFTWHPFAVDPNTDYSTETPTLVEFRLEETATGTLLVLTESGFDKIPSNRRKEAFLRNDGGWTQQMKNIEAYVDKTS
jgi:uncharacterized protein YndB with AHSA1/START domain